MKKHGKKIAKALKVAQHIRKARKNPEESMIPAGVSADLMDVVAPGAGAYAGSRMLAKLVRNLAAKKWPALARHVGAGTSLSALAVVWLAASHVRSLKKYRSGLVVGAAIAALQTLIQTYFGGLGWIIDAPAMRKALPTPPLAPVDPDAPDASSWGTVNEPAQVVDHPAPSQSVEGDDGDEDLGDLGTLGFGDTWEPTISN